MKRLLTLLGVWSLLAVLFSLQILLDSVYSGRPLRWTQALVLALAGWYGWALLSPLVIFMARRLALTLPGILIHLFASLVITFVKIAVTTEALRFAGYSKWTALIVNVPLNIATYWAIVMATRAIDIRLRASRLEASLTAARLELLRSQIHPHFLFNTLHGISELMHEDVDAADRMLTRLSDLLRASLESAGRAEVPLRQELGTVEHYTDIERLRLGERLRVRVEATPDTLDVLVPNFILQPLVENAIRHAVAARAEGGSIVIRARMNAAGLQLEVEDDGEGFAQAQPGVGLTNVRDRMRHLYGSDNVAIETAPGGGALVRLTIPRRAAA